MRLTTNSISVSMTLACAGLFSLALHLEPATAFHQKLPFSFQRNHKQQQQQQQKQHRSSESRYLLPEGLTSDIDGLAHQLAAGLGVTIATAIAVVARQVTATQQPLPITTATRPKIHETPIKLPLPIVLQPPSQPRNVVEMDIEDKALQMMSIFTAAAEEAVDEIYVVAVIDDEPVMDSTTTTTTTATTTVVDTPGPTTNMDLAEPKLITTNSYLGSLGSREIQTKEYSQETYLSSLTRSSVVAENQISELAIKTIKEPVSIIDIPEPILMNTLDPTILEVSDPITMDSFAPMIEPPEPIALTMSEAVLEIPATSIMKTTELFTEIPANSIMETPEPILESPETSYMETPEPDMMEIPAPIYMESLESDIMDLPATNIMETPEPIVESPEPVYMETPKSDIMEIPATNIMESPEPIMESPETSYMETPEPDIMDILATTIMETPEPTVESPEPILMETLESDIMDLPATNIIETPEPVSMEMPETIFMETPELTVESPQSPELPWSFLRPMFVPEEVNMADQVRKTVQKEAMQRTKARMGQFKPSAIEGDDIVPAEPKAFLPPPPSVKPEPKSFLAPPPVETETENLMEIVAEDSEKSVVKGLRFFLKKRSILIAAVGVVAIQRIVLYIVKRGML